MKGKRVQFDDETWTAIHLLAQDRMQDFQELADEAFRDILRKYGRPTSLKEALRKNFPTYEPEVELVWEPAWSPEKITEDGRTMMGM